MQKKHEIFRCDIKIMERLKDKSAILGSPIFKDLPQQLIDKIAETAQDIIVPANTIVFKQGDPGDCFYIILAGRARIYRKTQEGIEIEMDMLGPGDSVGEMSIMTGEPRSAYLETIEETHMLMFEKAQFDQILLDYPNISLVFVKKMSKKLLIERKTQRIFQKGRQLWVDYIIIILVSLMCCIIFNITSPKGLKLFPAIGPDEKVPLVETSQAVNKFLEGKTIFVDARPNAFFEKGHIKGSQNIPLSLFDIMYMMELSGVEKTRNIIVYGRTFSRLYDQDVARRLILRGHESVMVLKNGLKEWEKKGMPVEQINK